VLARSLLFMRPLEGRRDELIDLFERLGVPERALQQEGCLSVELQVAQEPSEPVLVTALWSDRDAYDGWLSNPWRERAGGELEALLTEPPEGTVYDIRLAAGAAIPEPPA
jgi:quinol monooxygenase YgiN